MAQERSKEMEQFFCEYCGSPLNDKMRFCTNCGAKNKFFVDPSAYNGTNSRNTGEFAENGGEAYGNAPNMNGQYGNNQYGGNQFGNNPNGGVPPMWIEPNPPQRIKANTGMLVFSILNIVFGCCCGAGCLVGIAALVFTLLAPKATTEKQMKTYNTIALVLNIVAVALTVIIVGVGFATGFEEFMTEFEKGLEAGLGSCFWFNLGVEKKGAGAGGGINPSILDFLPSSMGKQAHRESRLTWKGQPMLEDGHDGPGRRCRERTIGRDLRTSAMSRLSRRGPVA